MRRKTRIVRVGNTPIGCDNAVVVQSMCSTSTKDVDATVKQILDQEAAGCEITRIAIPDMESAKCVSKIKEKIHIPLVADIFYDYKLGMECIRQGADKIRINPALIPEDKLKILVAECKKHNKAMRIGINWGSLPKHIKEKYGHSPEALVHAALEPIELFESWDFRNFVVSLKSSTIKDTIESNKLFSEKSDYPLHIGVTEAGTLRSGLVKSSVALGNLLMQGIGDTIRISLSADPVEEVVAAHILLRSLGLREGAQLVSCPTCARTEIDIMKIAAEVEKRIMPVQKNLTVGVMGCFVNADEAKMSDIGIAGAADNAIIFKNGELLKRVPKEDSIEELMKEIEGMVKDG